MKDESLTEVIKGEEEYYTDDSIYNITSYGTDMMLGQIASMYKAGDIERPDLQRNFVWTKKEASRFIDSILLGLPVPSVFFAKDNENRLIIVDGLQRITSIVNFIDGTFSGDGTPFKLTKSESIYAAWRGKAYEDLSEAQQRAIRTYSLHAIIFEQKKPSDNSGMYQIFERINTGGRILKSQEIRNCIYHGSFNSMLRELNQNEVWRTILNLPTPDPRMGDVELILRFLAFSDLPTLPEFSEHQISLVKFLNSYMEKNRELSDQTAAELSKRFVDVITYLNRNIGQHVFRTAKVKDGGYSWARKVNPVVFDSICTATYLFSKEETLPEKNLLSAYEHLITDPTYIEVTKQRTTNITNIKKRINLSCKALYGCEIL